MRSGPPGPWPRSSSASCIWCARRCVTPPRSTGGSICRELREIYTAPTVDAAEARFAEFAERWRDRYPAMIDTWERAWAEFVPFLEFPVELRTVVYTTNAIESLNARFRQAVRHRGHFPNEQAALKVLYLVATERRKNRANPDRADQRLETHPERSHHPLRRPHPGRQLTMTLTPGYTTNRTVPFNLGVRLPSYPQRRTRPR